MSRPELQQPPHLFYNLDESEKYTNCSRIINIQSQLTERCIQLLNIDDNVNMVLDIGCGSGLSGQQLTDLDIEWVGLDISQAMLRVAQQNNTEGELLLSDIGQGFRFRPGVFDGAISVSALQWLCYSWKKIENPYKRLRIFFESLKNCLKNQARAVFQFYPENNEQINMITNSALKAGFVGDVIVDYPNSAKAKKIYLVLQLGGGNASKTTMNVIEGLQEEDNEEKATYLNSTKKKISKKGKNRPIEKSKTWIVKRKAKQQRQGRQVKETTKYTGRKRNNLGLFK